MGLLKSERKQLPSLLVAFGVSLAMQTGARADAFPFISHHLLSSPDFMRHIAQGVGDVVRDGTAAVSFVVSGGDPVAAEAGYVAGSVVRHQLYMIGGVLHNNGGAPPQAPPPPPRMAIPPATSAIAYHFYYQGVHYAVIQTGPPRQTPQGLVGPRWVDTGSNGFRGTLTELDRTAQFVTLRNDANGRICRILSNGMEFESNGQMFVPSGIHGVVVGMRRIN